VRRTDRHLAAAQPVQLCRDLVRREQFVVGVLLGYAVTPLGVFDAATYGLSSSYQYLAALGDEPERLAARPITKIGRVPLPFAFTGLWDADVRAWMARHGNSDEVCAALATGDRRYLIPQA
jgi:hypothetical protein